MVSEVDAELEVKNEKNNISMLRIINIQHLTPNDGTQLVKFCMSIDAKIELAQIQN